jgi:hypothetical protein
LPLETAAAELPAEPQPAPETVAAESPAEPHPAPETSKADKLVARFRAPPARRRPVLGMLITCAVVTLAAGLGWAMWDAYMGAPWTRDGTVRVYVVTMAPEVAGRIANCDEQA